MSGVKQSSVTAPARTIISENGTLVKKLSPGCELVTDLVVSRVGRFQEESVHGHGLLVVFTCKLSRRFLVDFGSVTDVLPSLV